MNKFVKIAFLIITLAIPVVIFLFLKMFGTNKFDIPVYYQDEGSISACQTAKAPFYLPDSLFVGDKGQLAFLFEEGMSDETQLTNQINRLKDSFSGQMPNFVVYANSPVKLEGVKTQVMTNSYSELLHCGYLAEKSNQYVLVDNQKRIRGYYGTDLDEQDRLIVELKILNENGDN
ncbi:hypothetical protein LVD15_15925 [Fulvivirga maritima]|uniref:hypothetical protein n=1 Tax=Fulvivirga maritima TaxID=2904247 RepID=UPI001F29177C|nr:hypothetical protein [Fulvivirga maritima]UII24798.1 hypothetical protein LVD15_15925 [Fulvivirga maritima]